MKYIIGNLKMNLTYKESQEYIKKLKKAINKTSLSNVTIGIAFSHDAMSLIKWHRNRNFLFGTQNIFHLSKGAYTGEVSVRSASEFQLDFVLLGHSERRIMFNETNELINHKMEVLEQTKIRPILCVGENLEEFNENKTEEVIKNQLSLCLRGINKLGDLIVSYEPIYAIGNGMIPELSHIRKIVKFIKNFTHHKVPVLYGGSVSITNIEELNTINELDGYLVGGAALDPKKFVLLAKKMDS
ncbi:triose-phosphate isomerase [Metamycoplasma buccale]|uniref:triose-phosphate isomerase n=1 Tax=Metamycoplasma buccale TaxID=55602 RepID=UPI00398EFB41